MYIITNSSTGTSNKSPILAVRYENIGDVEVESDYRWHTLSNTDLDDVKVAQVYSDKLWIAGFKSSTGYIRYYSLADDDYPTTGTHTIITSYYESQFRGTNKCWFSFELRADNLDANKTVKVEWQKDEDTSWTELAGAGSGIFTTAGTKNFQTNTYGKRIRFQLTLATNSATISPEITGIIVRGILAPDTLRIQEWWVKCADYIPMKNGQPDSRLGSEIKSLLETAATSAKEEVWPATAYDIWGNSMRCRIQAPTPEEEITGDYIPDKVESVIHLILQEM